MVLAFPLARILLTSSVSLEVDTVLMALWSRQIAKRTPSTREKPVVA